jgi:hypothetical protein
MSEHEYPGAAQPVPSATALVNTAQDALERLARQTEAVDEFVGTWMTSGLIYQLVPEYTCTFTCSEAEALASLLEAFGHKDAAESVIQDHSEHDECGDSHHDDCPDCSDA